MLHFQDFVSISLLSSGAAISAFDGPHRVENGHGIDSMGLRRQRRSAAAWQLPKPLASLISGSDRSDSRAVGPQ